MKVYTIDLVFDTYPLIAQTAVVLRCDEAQTLKCAIFRKSAPCSISLFIDILQFMHRVLGGQISLKLMKKSLGD